VRKLSNRQCAFPAILIVTMLLCRPVIAQKGLSGSGTRSWGSYTWQVTQATATTFVLNATFKTPPDGVDIPSAATAPRKPMPITLPAATRVHEVHGKITLTVPESATPTGSTPMNGSIIAQLVGPDNNVIASVKMQQFGPGIATLPISGTFSTALSVSSLYVVFYVDLPGVQIVNMSLTMD
jgi:hypothetical protein